jgi:uncharacterized protein YfaS (alpha-2-macroglobulin family)
LLTRQGTRTSTEIAAARKRLEERYRGQWESDLTAAWLAAALDLMRQERDDKSVDRPHEVRRWRVGRHVQRSDDARRAVLFIISKHFPERLRDLPKDVLTTLVQRVNEG